MPENVINLQINLGSKMACTRLIKYATMFVTYNVRAVPVKFGNGDRHNNRLIDHLGFS